LSGRPPSGEQACREQTTRKTPAAHGFTLLRPNSRIGRYPPLNTSLRLTESADEQVIDLLRQDEAFGGLRPQHAAQRYSPR
jgi:hypothetical protein